LELRCERLGWVVQGGLGRAFFSIWRGLGLPLWFAVVDCGVEGMVGSMKRGRGRGRRRCRGLKSWGWCVGVKERFPGRWEDDRRVRILDTASLIDVDALRALCIETMLLDG
jgi:hypothetical protein